MRQPAEDPPRSARRRRLQGRRRLPLDRQRRPPLPGPPGHGARVQGPERLRRPPARDRRFDDRRGDDQRPGQVRPAGSRPLQPGDGVVRARHRQLPDPGDHEPEQLHREPRRPAPGRGRAERPHRARPTPTRPPSPRSRPRRPRSPSRSATPRSRRPASRPRSTAPRSRRPSRVRSPRRSARQAVVEQETQVAELQAQQKEQQLQVDVRKPADAEAYRQTTLATASSRRRASARPRPTRTGSPPRRRGRRQARGQGPGRGPGRRHPPQRPGRGDAIRARGLAEADAIRARMKAEAAGIERRAAALSQNQEAVIAQQIAENLPDDRSRGGVAVRARRPVHGPQRRRRA